MSKNSKTPKNSPASKEAKKVAKKPAAQAKPRMVKAPEYSSFRLQRKLKPTTKPVLGSFRLFAGAVMILTRHWKPFLAIVVIYGLLMVLLAKGMDVGANLTNAKNAIADNGNGNNVATGAALFSYLLGGGETKGESATLFQIILTVVTSLAIIWGLRQAYADNIVKAKESFYRGMYPLVPFVLVCLIILLQILPMAAGLFLYNIVATVSTSGIELFAWLALLFVLTTLSFYMLSSSLLALYIVSLPDMKPLQALRSARQLVRLRRWTVLRRMLFLPVALLVIGAVIMIPLIMLVPVVGGVVFLLYSVCCLAVVHSYMYRLYRELL